jgi:uncharacterized coiled-coil protein SlyX
MMKNPWRVALMGVALAALACVAQVAFAHNLVPVDVMGAAGVALMGVGSTASVDLAKSKMFRVAVEGATIDGRTIDRAWLTQAAAQYNPTVYGARVNMEHIRGYSANSDFKAYGDVLELSASEITEGPLKGKMALYASIQPTADLVKLNKAGQKIYTSCEFNPSFADTKQAYLTGLAVTDNPASLGTQVLSFSAAHPTTNLFSEALETSIEFEEQKTSIVSELLSKVTAMLSKKPDTPEVAKHFADVSEAVEAVANHSAQQATAIENLSSQLATEKARGDKLATEFSELVQKLNATDGGAHRPNVTGNAGGGAAVTDC